jgi:hypothetical protein
MLLIAKSRATMPIMILVHGCFNFVERGFFRSRVLTSLYFLGVGIRMMLRRCFIQLLITLFTLLFPIKRRDFQKKTVGEETAYAKKIILNED